MYPAPDARDGDWEPSWLEFEQLQLQLGEMRIHGWFCPAENARASILHCHGNGEHVAYLAEEIAFLQKRLRANVLVFDYPGYGRSTGRPSEDSILASAEAARDWLAERTGLSPGRLVLWGRSLGGAVAVHLASQQGARALILDRTFSSMVEVAASHFPFLPVRWLLRNRFPSDERIVKYAGPLVQVHGREDRVVKWRLGKRLFEAAPSDCKHWLEPTPLTHNAPLPREFYDLVTSVLDQTEA